MNYYPDFARLLNEYLWKRDRTPTWLAKQLGVHHGTVPRWINDLRRPGSRKDVVRIAKVLSLSKSETEELLAAAGYYVTHYRLPEIDIDELSSRATKLFLTGRVSEAYDICRQILGIDPYHPVANRLRRAIISEDRRGFIGVSGHIDKQHIAEHWGYNSAQTVPGNIIDTDVGPRSETQDAEGKRGKFRTFGKISMLLVLTGITALTLVEYLGSRDPSDTLHQPIATVRAYIEDLYATATPTQTPTIEISITPTSVPIATPMPATSPTLTPTETPVLPTDTPSVFTPIDTPEPTPTILIDSSVSSTATSGPFNDN